MYIPCKIKQITEFSNHVFIFLSEPVLSGNVFCGHPAVGKVSTFFPLVTAIFISIKWSLPLSGCGHPFLSINCLFVQTSTCTERSHETEPLIKNNRQVKSNLCLSPKVNGNSTFERALVN